MEAILEVLYIEGSFRGFIRFAWKAPAVGFFLNKVIKQDCGVGVFPWICKIFGSTCLVEHKQLFLYCFRSSSIIISFWICKTRGMQVFYLTWCFLLLLFASADIEYFDLKLKQTEFFFFFQRKYFLQITKN